MVSPPLVSVVLPVRDGAAFLEAAIDSILRQTLRAAGAGPDEALELIVVDDGSVDATPAILRRMTAAGAAIRVLRPGTPGLVAALNTGLRAAGGRYVARMDADDLAHPQRLALQAARLDAAPGVAVAGSAWRVIGADGRVRRSVTPPASPAAIRVALATHNPIAHPSAMLRRDAVLAIGGYRPAFLLAEDFDLWLRLSERHDLVNLPETLLDYREHEGQSAWRDIEQRALSEMAALAAASRRKQTSGPDEADGGAAADRALLRRLGLTDRQIAAGLVGRALGGAKTALACGQREAAARHVAFALRQPGLHPRTRLHLHLLALRARR